MWTKQDKIYAIFVALVLVLMCIYIYLSLKEKEKETALLTEALDINSKLNDFVINDISDRVKQLEEKNKPGYFKRLISQVKQNNNS